MDVGIQHVPDENMETLFGNDIPITRVQWEITRACNLKCEHCSVEAKKPRKYELTQKEAMKFVDDFVSEGGLKCVVTGGEPFMRPDLLDLLEYISDRGLSINLLTNGTLLTEEKVERLANVRLSMIQVSIDGLKETHDAFRGVRGGFDSAIEGIKLVVEKCRNPLKIIKCVVHKGNINEMVELMKLAADLKVDLFAPQVLEPIGRAALIKDEIPSVAEVMNMMSSLINAVQTYPELLLGTQLPPALWYPWSNFLSYFSAQAGHCLSPTMIGITSNGDVGPCGGLARTEKFRIGNIRNKSLKELWKLSGENKKVISIIKGKYTGICKKCIFHDTCSGPCSLVEGSPHICQQAYEEGLFSPDCLLQE